MTDKYDMSDTEKDKLAQSMGFGSWYEYINLDTERFPEKETKTMLRDSSMSHVPDLTLSEEQRYRLSNISNGGLWSLEEIANIGELKYGEGLTWKDTTSKMNEKYDKDFTTVQVRSAYHTNKHRLTDEEE